MAFLLNVPSFNKTSFSCSEYAFPVGIITTFLNIFCLLAYVSGLFVLIWLSISARYTLKEAFLAFRCLKTDKRKTKINVLAYGLMIGGIIGNMLDRIFYQKVIMVAVLAMTMEM